MNKLTNNNQPGIQIIKEEKSVLNTIGIVDNNQAAPKYYFADENGNRLSKSYYSIEKLDEIHYIVSELDFMYGLGFDEWVKYYDNDFKDVDIFRFKFHYGVVSAIDNKITEVVPTVYKNIKKTNSNVIIVYSDESYKIIFDGEHKSVKEEPKLGCINLDINSNSYVMNIIPPFMDKIMDFDLEYEGYAKVYMENIEGYISKEIDFEKYQEIINLYYLFKSKQINYKTFIDILPNAIEKVLLSQEQVIAKEQEKKHSLTLGKYLNGK